MSTARIRTAVVGFGTAGRIFHAPFIAADEEFSLAAVVTGNLDRAAEAKRLHPDVAVLEDVDSLLARAEEFDLVVVGSPPASHHLIADAALRAGLAVVVDKPFAVTSSGARQLIKTAEELGRPLTVFQNRRWDGDYLTVRRLVEAGVLGTVRRFESRFEWWKPAPQAGWKTQTPVSEGGGILYDLGTHLIDQALQLFGPVDEVYSEVRTSRIDGAADDDSFVALTHASGVISHLWMSSVAPQFGPRFHLLGSEAGFTCWGLDGQEPTLKAGALPTEPDFGLTVEENWGIVGADGDWHAQPTERGDYAGFYRGLADALLRGRPVPVDPADAVHVLELIESIHGGH